MKPNEKHSAESRAKMSASQTGRKLSPETRAKMAEAAKKRWEDPTYRAQQTELRKICNSSPERRSLASRLAKQQWADPVLREKQHITRGTDEYKNKMSRVMKIAYLKSHLIDDDEEDFE